MSPGVSSDTVFREIEPGVGFEAGDFAKERLRGLHRRTAQLRYIMYVSLVGPVIGGGSGSLGPVTPPSVCLCGLKLFRTTLCLVIAIRIRDEMVSYAIQKKKHGPSTFVRELQSDMVTRATIAGIPFFGENGF